MQLQKIFRMQFQNYQPTFPVPRTLPMTSSMKRPEKNKMRIYRKHLENKLQDSGEKLNKVIASLLSINWHFMAVCSGRKECQQIQKKLQQSSTSDIGEISISPNDSLCFTPHSTLCIITEPLTNLTKKLYGNGKSQNNKHLINIDTTLLTSFHVLSYFDQNKPTELLTQGGKVV